MRVAALILLAVTVMVGIFLSRKTDHTGTQTMIEDMTSSSMAAPLRPEIPL